MCSRPKAPVIHMPAAPRPVAPMRIENVDTAESAAATNNALRRRQRMALSRMSMSSGGAMQGGDAGAAGKRSLGE